LSATVSSLMQSVSTSAPSLPERSISVPVSDRSWPQAVSNTVQWMASANVQAATLRLSPEHLGPVEVHIDVQGAQVNVSFTAAHPDTRAALEQAVPKLREMFSGSGLTLGQASVQQDSRSGSHSAAPRLRATSQTDSEAPSAVAPLRSLGMVDEYA
jgi:flagellar hook-length control protein FliK